MAVNSKNLLGSKLLGRSISGQIDPMASMSNLMDVMLVFACGLMIALIAHYNVELSPSSPEIGNMEEIDGELEPIDEGISDSESQYAEVGMVYRDIETGQLYVVTPDGDEEILDE